MLTRLAHVVVRRARLVLARSVLGLVAAGAFGFTVFAHLQSGGFDDPASEASRAVRALQGQFGTGEPNVVLLVEAPAGVDTPAVAAAGVALVPAFMRLAGRWNWWSPAPLRRVHARLALTEAEIPQPRAEAAGRRVLAT